MAAVFYIDQTTHPNWVELVRSVYPDAVWLSGSELEDIRPPLVGRYIGIYSDGRVFTRNKLTAIGLEGAVDFVLVTRLGTLFG